MSNALFASTIRRLLGTCTDTRISNPYGPDLLDLNQRGAPWLTNNVHKATK
ncbi:hypothetical protein [Pseudomonas sp. R5(2019)]|uniref:hypothetical protein n=1 Tax=Pseudomonas sp. R5(2019) TaxID=2697566 RepID=UPI0014129168|nr:hypothetical protein [Pseudomonas sp. R5(2019)]NBA97536.1 hypothetical protein [Pseudomonas sp. R5(2019)]